MNTSIKQILFCRPGVVVSKLQTVQRVRKHKSRPCYMLLNMLQFCHNHVKVSYVWVDKILSLEQTPAGVVRHCVSVKKHLYCLLQADRSRLRYSDQRGVSNSSGTQPLHQGTDTHKLLYFLSRVDVRCPLWKQCIILKIHYEKGMLATSVMVCCLSCILPLQGIYLVGLQYLG